MKKKQAESQQTLNLLVVYFSKIMWTPFGLTVFLKNFTVAVYMKKILYLIYYMDKMFFKLLCITVALYLKNLFLKK